jgi:hypothetical protein
VKKSYNFLQDPGHGWLAVPLKDCHALGLFCDSFSPYSYVSKAGTTLYLEEDLDASVFVKAYVDRFGNKPVLVEKHTNARSYVRSLPSNSGTKWVSPYAKIGRTSD